ncbi:unnamed protein product [Malus baccata var. baccata]
MILSALGPDHALTNFPVGHPSWDCSHANSLNFGVPMEPEASELAKGLVTHPGNASAPFSFNFGVPTELKASKLPKGLVLGRDENIHIRLTRSTPLDNVGCYNFGIFDLIHIFKIVS